MQHSYIMYCSGSFNLIFQKFGVNKIIIFKEINIFLLQSYIKLIMSDTKDIYNITIFSV